jgi:hypothetical protein
MPNNIYQQPTIIVENLTINGGNVTIGSVPIDDQLDSLSYRPTSEESLTELWRDANSVELRRLPRFPELRVTSPSLDVTEYVAAAKQTRRVAWATIALALPILIAILTGHRWVGFGVLLALAVLHALLWLEENETVAESAYDRAERALVAWEHLEGRQLYQRPDYDALQSQLAGHFVSQHEIDQRLGPNASYDHAALSDVVWQFKQIAFEQASYVEKLEKARSAAEQGIADVYALDALRVVAKPSSPVKRRIRAS